MPVRSASAVWEGALPTGKGTMKVGGLFEGAYSAASRFEEAEGTNPEELIGAAHAGCFSMAFANELDKAGHKPERVETTARVEIRKVEGGFAITGIELDTVAAVPGIQEAEFMKIAEAAKNGCPVSKALSAVKVTLKARLSS